MSVEDKLSELIDTINRAMKYNSPYTSPGTSGGSGSGAAGSTARKYKTSTKHDPNASPFAKNMNLLANVVGHAHGGVENFTYSLGKAAEGFVALELAVGAFKAVLDVGRTYSKMTDIGEGFNGSMFDMMQQVGRAGLSLDQFSALMSRNSQATAVMGRSNTQTMGALQLAVRNNLEQFGFFGMSLDDLTNTASDYMETLRESGNLNKYTANQQSQSVTDLITESSALAKVFGTSREAIIKQTNEIMRQTALQGRLSMGTEQQTEAARNMVTMFAAQSPKLASMAGEQLGQGGYVNTAMGKALIGSGFGQVNEILQRNALDPASRGQKANALTPLMMAEQFDDAAINRLESLQKISPEAAETLAFANELRASQQQFAKRDAQGQVIKENGHIVYDHAAAAKAEEEAEKQQDAIEGITRMAMDFESAFRKVTGGLIDGFYSAFSGITSFWTKILGDDKGQNFQNAVSGLEFAFKGLGFVLGTMLAVVTGLVSAFGYMLGILDKGVIWFKELFGFKQTDKDGKDITTSGPVGGLVSLVVTVATILMGMSYARRFGSFLINGTLSGARRGAGAALGAVTRIPGGTGFLGRMEKGAGEIGKLAKKIPGASLFGRLGGAAAGAAAGAAVGDGCCDDISKGLGALKDRIDFHGERAHTNASALRQAGEEAIVKAEEGLGNAAVMKNAATTGVNLAEENAILAEKHMNIAKDTKTATTTGAELAAKNAATGAESLAASEATAGATETAAALAAKNAATPVVAGVEGAAATAKGTASLAERAGLHVGKALAKTGTLGLAERAGTAVVKAGASSLGKSAMKTIVPGLGMIFAAQRAWEGDYFGAGIDALSGFATLFPELGGNIVAGMLQATNATRDIVGHDTVDGALKSLLPGSSDTDTKCDDRTMGYYHNGIATADSSVALTPGMDVTLDSVNGQLDQLQKNKTDLEAREKFDTRMGDTTDEKKTAADLLRVNHVIAALLAQQLKLQKEGDLKMLNTVQQNSAYSMPVY